MTERKYRMDGYGEPSVISRFCFSVNVTGILKKSDNHFAN